MTVYLNYGLRNATNGALIPLKNSTTKFVHAVASYTAGTPKSYAAVSAQDTFLLETPTPGSTSGSFTRTALP